MEISSRNTTPEKIKECLITFEDKHFYHHWGVNPFAIGRAFYQNVKNKRIVSGGSTLTMQTIRLARNESRTFREKLIEMIWATRLEFRASKEEILSMYISHAPFGGNVVGLDAAAWRYFGHSADDLSWAESAMLAVLPNAPAMIHLSKGRKTLLDKRNRLLKQLLEKKTIDSSTYELAISEPLPDEPHPLPQIAPYLVSRFYQERNGEYSRSTINKGIQTQIEDLAERWSNEFRRSDIRNLAILVIDIPSNQVVAYCGNVHFDQKAGRKSSGRHSGSEKYGQYSQTFLILRDVTGRKFTAGYVAAGRTCQYQRIYATEFQYAVRRGCSRFGSSRAFIKYSRGHDATKIRSPEVS